MKNAGEHRYQVVVLDTAPHADQAALQAARVADLVLVPCRPALFDLMAIRSTLDTYQHATSTAPMGSEQDTSAVVDGLGAVRGVDDLRVIDASIFLDIPSAPPNLTVIMAAEHIAAILIARNLI